MAKQRIDNGNWFDTSKAERFEESTMFNGNNHISDVTGSQWNHEELYLTASGVWVMHAWSQWPWQGRSATWTIIEPARAAGWLMTCDRDAAERLFPKEVEAKEV